MTVRYEDVRDVGFFLFAAGCWFVVVFANNGVITGSLVIILGADILIAGLLGAMGWSTRSPHCLLASARG